MTSETPVCDIFTSKDANKQHDFNFCKKSDYSPMDVDDITPPNQSYCKKQKLNNGASKVRIRKLIDNGDNTENVLGTGFKKQLSKFKILLIIAMLLGLTAITSLSGNFHQDLIKHYKRQYNKLVYGTEDYCYQYFNFANITNALHKNLIGQTEAINHIEKALKEHVQYSSIAIYGRTGIGKSYTSKLMTENFQWLENVHNFKWDLGRSGERNFNNFQNFMFNIRQKINIKCGHNIVFIENLSEKDVMFMNKINEKLKLASLNDNIKIISAFIVSIPNYNSETRLIYEDKINGFINNLNNGINSIEFNILTDEDLKNCVRLEAAALRISLNENQFNDVIAGINVNKSGCKAVQAKVKIYGTSY